MKRITFSPGSQLFAGNRMLQPLESMYARVLVADESPNRPGERIECLLGPSVTPWAQTSYITEVDPTTDDLVAIGPPIEVVIESIHVY